MAIDQQTKAAAFAALHKRDGAFVIPNPWDRGSARILAAMGFEALATTSAAAWRSPWACATAALPRNRFSAIAGISP